MTITKTFPSGTANPTPAAFNIPEAGEKNWSSLSNFLSALADGAQATTFQKIAIRQATSTPVTVSTNDCLVAIKLSTPGAVAVNLPAGAAKQVFYIYDETGDAVTNNITINRSGTDTIEGATSIVVSTNKELVGLCFDATSNDWKIFLRAKPNIDVGSISGLGAGVAAWLADPTSAKLATAVTDETGSGLLVFNNAPTLIAPVLGTPASGDLSNCTNFPIAGLTGTTTGSGALVFATSPVLVTPNIGTPSAGDLSNCTNLPLSSGVTGALPIANGGTAATGATAAFDNLAPTTTKGDLTVRNASNNVRLAAGADGQVLQADSTASEGVSWADAGGGAGEINAVDNPSAASDTTGYTAGTSHTVTRDTSNSPLDPTINTCLDISASASATESSTSGVYYSISTLPEAIRNWKLKVEFFVDVPATDEWSLSVYDGSTRLPLSTDDQTTGATVLPAGFTGRFSAYFNSTSNAAYSVNFTCTSFSGTTNLYVTNLVVGPGIGQAGAAIEDWVSYTPTTQGIGTPTSVNIEKVRIGSNLFIRGYFTTGTTTGDLFQLGLDGLTIGGVGSDSINVGIILRDAASVNNPLFLLATPGDTYLEMGSHDIRDASADNPLTPVAGNFLGGSGTRCSFEAGPIPISSYAGKGIIPMLVEDNLSEWQSFTPSWTNAASSPTRNTGKYRRVGSDLEIAFRRIEANSDGSAASLILTLPNNYTYDLTKIPDGASSETSSAAGVLKGSGGWYEDTGGVFYGLIAAPNGSNNQIAFSRTDGDTVGFILGSEVAANDEFQGTFIIPITQFAGSQNSLVGYSEASPTYAGLVKTNTGATTSVVGEYEEANVTLDSGVTGTAKFVRIGNLVTVTGTSAWTHSSATGFTTTTGLIPESFRPTNDIYNTYISLDGSLAGTYRVQINSNGSIGGNYYDASFTLVNRTGTATGPSLSYVIT